WTFLGLLSSLQVLRHSAKNKKSTQYEVSNYAPETHSIKIPAPAAGLIVRLPQLVPGLNWCQASTGARSLLHFPGLYSTSSTGPQLVPGLYSTLSQLVPGLCRGINWCRASTPRSVPGLCSAIGARSLLRNWCQVSFPTAGPTGYWGQVSTGCAPLVVINWCQVNWCQ